MSISAVSGIDASLAALATQQASSEVQSRIALKVLKDVMDQGQQQAAALLGLNQPAPQASDGLGQNVDLYA